MHSIDPLKITDLHPVLVLINQSRGTNYSTIEKRLKHSEKSHQNIINNYNIHDTLNNENKDLYFETENHLLQWKDVKDLTVEDMLVYTIPQYVNDINSITQDDCYMYGIILGDGCMNNKLLTGYISLHTINKNYILEFCKNYF